MWESANTSRQVCRSPSWATRLAAISAIFDQWVRLTPLSYFLQVSFRNAAQFALASEGALLPLRYTEPALSPLLALPSNLAPRKPRLGVLPTLIRKAGAKVHLFCQFSKSKNEMGCNLYKIKIIVDRFAVSTALSGGGAIAPVFFALRAYCAPICPLSFPRTTLVAS